jgi:hypothetical protein
MGVAGEEEGEAESGRGEETLCENVEDRPATAAAAVRAAPRKKRDMSGTSGGQDEVGLDYGVVSASACVADWGRCCRAERRWGTGPAGDGDGDDGGLGGFATVAIMVADV